MSDDLADSVEAPSAPEAEEVSNDQPEDDVEASESIDTEPEEAEDTGEESESDEDQPEEGSEPETVRVEYDGEEFDLPPKLKDALMRDQDYTAKTQSLGDERRSYEAEKADFAQYMEASTAHSQSIAELTAIDQQLQSFQQYDWNAAFDADITAATKLQHQMQQLQASREGKVQEIQAAEDQRTKLQDENMRRTAERTDAAMAKKVPNWGDERKAELGRFAVETLGFPIQAVKNAVTEGEIMTLHLAEIGFQTLNRAKTKTKAAGAKAPTTAPSKNLKPKRQSAPKSLSSVTDPSQYREMRLAQKRKKAS